MIKYLKLISLWLRNARETRQYIKHWWHKFRLGSIVLMALRDSPTLKEHFGNMKRRIAAVPLPAWGGTHELTTSSGGLQEARSLCFTLQTLSCPAAGERRGTQRPPHCPPGGIIIVIIICCCCWAQHSLGPGVPVCQASLHKLL